MDTLILPERTLIVPIAVPGSGKTTLLNRIEQATGLPGFRHGPDDVRRTLFGNVSYQGNGGLVHAAAQAMLKARLAEGIPAAYDATNVTAKTRRVILDIAQDFEYHTVALILEIPISIAHARNQDRTAGRVPDYVIDRMYKQMHSGGAVFGFDEIIHCDERTTEINVEWRLHEENG